VSQSDEKWPALPWADWRETAITLQLWTQIAGKVRLALTPWLNHSWQVPLYLSARGLTTSPIPTAGEIFELEFDFVDHRLACHSSRGDGFAMPLEPCTVAEFHNRLLTALAGLGITVAIDPRPNEIADAIPFPTDREHGSYDAAAAHRFWRALVQVDRVFKLFRSGFLGKASPVHFFWGSFDLAVTRFSGRRAPLHPGGVPGLPDRVTQEAYSHEVSSAGFWPGSDSFPQPAFYSYAYPEPPHYREQAIGGGVGFDRTLGEFILPYETVRQADDPDERLLDFLSKTYAAAADCAGWDRANLECPLGIAAVPRAVDAPVTIAR
jgi:hypothetical protein